MSKETGYRICAICKKPGGLAATDAMEALGFKVVRAEGVNVYAHPECITKKRKQLPRPAVRR